MRVTVEISSEHRARLLEIAARRGERGFSSIVAEAIDSYLQRMSALEKARRNVQSLRGSLKQKEADHLLQMVARTRGSWR